LLDAEAVVTFLQELSPDAAVGSCAGGPLPTLVVGKSIFWDYLPKLIYYVLCHDVHRCHFQTRDELHAVKRDGDAVVIFDIFANEFQQEFWLCHGALVIPEGKLVI
jgi:hypothetical protein